MARGQLTLIIIIALLIVIMVGVILYAARTVSEKKGEERLETQQKTAALLQPVQEYITQCLSLSAKDALEKFGMQGGAIYSSQGGTISDPIEGVDHILMDRTKVSYGIVPPIGTLGKPPFFFSDVPEYPWGSFPEFRSSTGDILFDEYFLGLYGYNNLPQLQKPDEDSAEEQLEGATLESAKNCFQFEIFEQQGIKVDPGEPIIEIVFGSRGTSFLMTYPLNVTSTVSGTTVKADAFAVELPVRLRKILQIANLAADKDVSNITFDASSFTVDGIGVSTSRDVAGNDDVILVRDPQSSIGGQLYEFQFARKNRAPALVYIPNSTMNSKKICGGTTISIQPSAIHFDTSVCDPALSSSSFSVTLNAYDPDEDNVTFSGVAGPSKKPLPYTITDNDVSLQIVNVIIRATDQELIDEQTLNISVVFSPTP